MDNHCLCKIREVYRSIISFETMLQSATGLNLNEAMLLCLLSDGECLLSGEISDKLQISRSNASKVISALEKQSLIRRQTCKEDSRCQKFHITKKGMQTLELIHCDNICIPETLVQLSQD